MSDIETDNRALLQRALVELREMRSRLKSVEQAKNEPIAIIGMGCRLPGGANNTDDLWRMLRDGVDAIREIPSDRWDLEEYYSPDPDAEGKTYARYGGFVDGVQEFDPHFFGISPREAMSLDPQQRMLLEVCWEAFEHGGLSPEKMFGSATGVFVGISGFEFALSLGSVASERVDPYFGTGNALSSAAGRLSYTMGLTGPCMSIDTACSSSLVSLHLACQSLRRSECDTALAAGVNCLMHPVVSIAFSKARMLAQDGRCKSFDARADGYVRGEGCGVIVLKRLTTALADGDRILALIRGSAVNQDGPSGALTVPSGPSQQAVIRKALADAGVMPDQVGYIEAHGTGTPLGDPIEIGALSAVFGNARNEPIVVGSIKTNIGHLEAAAGIAGLIKVVLSLQQAEIPPNLHFARPNPHIQWQKTQIEIPIQRRPWPCEGRPRIAGVSSFGFTGTNAHVVLEQPPEAAPRSSMMERTAHLLTLSAKTEEALSELAIRYRQQLITPSEVEPSDICFTASTGRAHFQHRLSLVAASREEMLRKLEAFSEGKKSPGLCAGKISGDRDCKLAFVFTGQGSQYVGMGQHLYETSPVFRETLEECDSLLRGRMERPLLEIIFPPREADNDLIHQTAYAQPSLFALEYGLTRLLKSWGVEPAAVLGHSVGEYVAACVAGVFSLEQALLLVVERGRLMQSLPKGGGMMAVFASQEETEKILQEYKPHISVAAINAPENTVISGPLDTLELAGRLLIDAGIRTRPLNVSHAFHSDLMTPMLPDFKQAACQVSYSAPRILVVSNLSGRPAQAEMANPDYWVRQVREPVRFAAGVQSLYRQGYRTFVEVGPKPDLMASAQASLPVEDMLWLSTLQPGASDWEQLLGGLGQLYTRGLSIDWHSFDAGYSRQRVTLPTYPFQRKKYWLLPPAELKGLRSPAQSNAKLKAPTEWFYSEQWQPENLEAALTVPCVPESDAKISPGFEEAEWGWWLILSNGSATERRITALMESQGEKCILVRRGHAREQIGEAEFLVDPSEPEHFHQLLEEATVGELCQLRGAIYICSPDTVDEQETSHDSMYAAASVECWSLINLVKALGRVRIPSFSGLWVVTQGAQPVNAYEQEAACRAAHSGLWGLGKVINLEHPELRCRLIDLDPEDEESGSTALWDEIQFSISSRKDFNHAAFRGARRYVNRLVRYERTALTPRRFSSDGSYLIMGGLGEIGLQLARWMVGQGAMHLALASRSRPGETALRAINELEQAGASVMVEQADVCDEGQLANLIGKIGATMPELKGVFHCAGLLEQSLIDESQWEKFDEVLAPKIKGVWNLHRQTINKPLDFFVMFSSVASLFGAPGLSSYAAANAFLDALAHHRHRLGLPALSINWGPWAGTGMASRISPQLGMQWAAYGIDPLPSSLALDALGQLLFSDAAQVAVFAIDWDCFLRELGTGYLPAYLSEIARELSAGVAVNQQENAVFRKLTEMSPDDRAGFLASHLKVVISDTLQSSTEQVLVDSDLTQLGMDSIMVMQVLNRLYKDLRLMIYPREFYERPRIEQLAPYLAAEFGRIHCDNNSSTPVVLYSDFCTVEAGEAPPLDYVARDEAAIEPNEDPLPGIAFILSSPRSGSTLLRAMLAGHPRLFAPPELHLLPFKTMTQRRSQLAQTHLQEGLQRALVELMGLSPDSSRAITDGWADSGITVREVYKQLQELIGERLLIDKSPSYAGQRDILKRAEKLFDGSRYIHLVRHPLAVIESFVRMRIDRLIGGNGMDAYDLAEQIWTISNRNILDVVARTAPDRYHRVRFEDLVQDPLTVTSSLCEFLGLDFHKGVLTPYEGNRMTDGLYADSAPIGDPNFVRRNRIDPLLSDVSNSVRLPRGLGKPAQDVASELGYALPDGRSRVTIEASRSLQTTAPPSAMRERYLRVRGLKLCVCSWGSEDAPLIFALHGILEQGAAWGEVAAHLVKEGFRVVAPDLRGHGRSDHAGPGGSYHLIDFLADIDSLIADVNGDKPFTLVGHSLGSILAAMFATARPRKVSALILVEPPLSVAESYYEPALSDSLVSYLDRIASPPDHPLLPDLAVAANHLRLVTPGLSGEFALRLAQRITEPCDSGLRWRWDPILGSRMKLALGAMPFPADHLAVFKQIQSPVTIVNGRESPYTVRGHNAGDLMQLENLAARFRVASISGGHSLHIDNPAALAQVISETATPEKVRGADENHQ